MLPIYDLKVDLNDFLLNNLITSKSSYDRQLFLEFANFASIDFSIDYFNKNFSHLLFMY